MPDQQYTRRRGNAETTRALLLDTAADLMRRIGLLHTTTKRIASEAGYSEATLYKHFPGKAELVLAVLRHRFPPFVDDLAALSDRAGRGPVAQNLTGVVVGAVPFFRHGAPVLGSLFAEPELLRRHWEEMESHGAGPLNVNRAVASYLRNERGLGRVPARIDPEAVASLLIGACFQRGFFEAFSGGRQTFPPLEQHAVELVAVTGLIPGKS
ncbi:TetR/AcrR family transcriptional regulator [Nocardiopsis kunsanensis]|uniref:TetR/AcrR family transcriptional regulator n=1 Tax=Nocardiopsis kunsanensis TaxID=141693 RepID=UPI00034AD249|nr:TetR/AcrR family transcriptional regulator [Nocardiopsis kunsanensis]